MSRKLLQFAFKLAISVISLIITSIPIIMFRVTWVILNPQLLKQKLMLAFVCALGFGSLQLFVGLIFVLAMVWLWLET